MSTGLPGGQFPDETPPRGAGPFRASSAPRLLKRLGVLGVGIAGVVTALAFLFRKTLDWDY